MIGHFLFYYIMETKSDCLNIAWENYQADPNTENKAEVDYWVEQTPVIGKEEIQAKLLSCIANISDGNAALAKLKLTNLFKNI